MNVNGIKNLASNNTARRFITTLGKTGAILPVVLLEATVTGGRTYHAYKRDGFVEARERVTEESLGAIFWLFGATMFGKMIEFLMKKSKMLPKRHFDVGKDSVRQPFNNLVLENLNNPKFKKDLYAKSKLGKIIAGLAIACTFIGYVVPKMNQAITNNFFAKRVEPAKPLDPRAEKMYEHFHHKANISINSVQNFKSTVMFGQSNEISSTPNKGVSNNAVPSFKGAEAFLKIAQNFEQNDIYKLMGTDIGTVSGRTINARNKDERIEILFRDISSIYFYCFSTPAILAFLSGKDLFKGKNTNLNPTTAMDVHNTLVRKMHEMNKTKMGIEEFKKFTLGEEKEYEQLMEKFFPKEAPKAPKKYLFGLIKVNPSKETRVLNIEDFNKIVDANVSDSARAKELKELGLKMTGLQPELKVKVTSKEGVKEAVQVISQKIITESQVEDVLRGGELRKPEVMKSFLDKIFGTNKNPNRLTDPHVYIQQSQIEAKRKEIIDYTESIIDHAKRAKSSEITTELMLNANKRNLTRNGLYWGAAMGVSALFLSTIIPKIQYWITKMRTGKDGFPGIENIRAQNEAKKA